MKLINYISFYQYFSNLDYKLSCRIDYLSNKLGSKLSNDEIIELHDLRIKRETIRIIERELIQFFIDL